mmetsp:Transcript_23532/g.56126  ORF Transcript_23532/g.56126 Transcript_23532/m.56126 type:complete len:261 (-) Transcript_23532:1314-2096(-)
MDHRRGAVVEEAESATELDGPHVHHLAGGPPSVALLSSALVVHVLQTPAVQELRDDDLGLPVQARAQEEHQVGVPKVRQDRDLVLEVEVVGVGVSVLEHLAHHRHAAPVCAQHVALLPLSEQLPHLHLGAVDAPLLGLGAEVQRPRRIPLHLQLGGHLLHLALGAGARVHEHLRDLSVAAADGVLERRSSPPVFAVDVGAALDEELDDLVMALGGGQMQRRAPVVVGSVNARAHAHEELDVLQVALGRCVAHAVAVVLVV